MLKSMRPSFLANNIRRGLLTGRKPDRDVRASVLSEHMAEDTKQPEIADGGEPSLSSTAADQSAAKPSGSAQADSEKKTTVEDALARVAAAKEAATAAPAAPRAPVKK